MKLHKKKLGSGIVRSRELEKKGLASYAVRITSGHVGNPGCAAVDLNAPEHVDRDAGRIKGRGTVQLCESMDAWAPQARRFGIGRRCLEAMLEESSLTVRILTESAEVRQDFDLIEKHRDRVLLGMRISGAPDQAELLRAIEPNASPIGEREAAVEDAVKRGLRTYLMFSSLLPGISTTSRALFQMFHFAEKCGAEEVSAELPDPHGPELRLCSGALARAGFRKEAEAVGRIQDKAEGSRYVAQLWALFRAHAGRFLAPERLRFFVYPSGLTDDDLASIWLYGAGVVWLGRSAGKRRIPMEAVERALLRAHGPLHGQVGQVTVPDPRLVQEGVPL